MRATNLEMVQRLTRSTCSGGVPNSGEHDCAIPVAWVLGSSSCKLHGLLGELSEGLDRAEEGGKRVGHGGCPRAALAGRGEVARAMGELGGIRRGTEEATGKTVGLWDGLYSRGVGVVMGGRRRAGVHARACSERPPSASPRRTRGSLLLPWFNDGFEHLSVRILAKPLCTVSSLLHILPFLCEFQAKIRSG
jgi:hypothetical protein